MFFSLKEEKKMVSLEALFIGKDVSLARVQLNTGTNVAPEVLLIGLAGCEDLLVIFECISSGKHNR